MKRVFEAAFEEVQEICKDPKAELKRIYKKARKKVRRGYKDTKLLYR